MSKPAINAVKLTTNAVLVMLTLSAVAAAQDVSMDVRHRALLKSHCYKCHNADEQEGQVRLDDLPFAITNIETAERWQKILNVLNAGKMPPDDEQPLPAEAKTNLLDDLSNLMVAARKKLSDQGGEITMRRLNRREYKNTLRELLGVKINVAELPSDSGTGGFDTAGQNLFMSATQIEQYQSLGREALEEAFALQAAALDWKKIERETDRSEPTPAEFKIHTNRQMAWSRGNGLNKVRFECENANPMIAAYVEQQKDERERAEQWVTAVDQAAERPENADIVAQLKKEQKRSTEYRRSWAKIKGAPSPESFGFRTPENNSDKAQAALGENWQTYHEYYLTRPALDRGAYLGVQTKHPSILALDHLQFPVPFSWKSGDYIFRVRVAATDDSAPEQRFLQAGMHPRNGKVLSTFAITGTLEEPQVVEMPFTLTREQADSGDRTLWIREKGAWEDNAEGGRKRAAAVKENGIGPVMALWIDWMEIERVSGVTRPMPSALAALDVPLDGTAKSLTVDEAAAAFTRFAVVAFRGREPSESYIQRLTSVYGAYLKTGAEPTAALKDTLSIILASPMFLYLNEPAVDGRRRQLTDLELASRLSYFLWSAPPDDALLDLARRGELSTPSVLAGQTTRLLNDPRASEFVHGFLYQWLSLERFDFFEVNRPMYPRFDDSTRLSAKNEVYETFAHILRHNAPLGDLLKSDYVVIDPVLADFYGIEFAANRQETQSVSEGSAPQHSHEVSPSMTRRVTSGSDFRKVSVPSDSPRGGLLGMAAINFMGGNGEQTSPVERGVWVLRKLLNDSPPPAPANIPQIERLAGKVLTTRERLLAHQEDAQCASCHRKIDPIGFGLENFDAVGQWRTEDTYQVKDENGKPVKGASKTWTIDTSAAFHAGPSFNDYFELRDILSSRADNFATGFSAALIEYALGRPFGFGDEPLAAIMVEAATKKKMSTREFIHALIASETFRTK